MIRENGPAENLKYETDYATPTPADGQVLVKNEFTGINFIDTYFRKGPAMGPAYTQARLRPVPMRHAEPEAAPLLMLTLAFSRIATQRKTVIQHQLGSQP